MIAIKRKILTVTFSLFMLAQAGLIYAASWL